MSIFKANVTGWFYKKTGYTLAGEGTFAPGVQIGIATVRFDLEILDTPVRAEASASRGRVEQEQAKAVSIMVPATVNIAEDDRLDVFGFGFNVASVFPEYDTFGKLDHKLCLLKRLELPTPMQQNGSV